MYKLTEAEIAELYDDAALQHIEFIAGYQCCWTHCHTKLSGYCTVYEFKWWNSGQNIWYNTYQGVPGGVWACAHFGYFDGSYYHEHNRKDCCR